MARKKNEEGIKARILKKAEEHFLLYGYSKTNIEDLVRDLRMSRKTIYQYFKGGKREILKELILKEQRIEYLKIEEIVQAPHMTFIEKQKSIFPMLMNRFLLNENLLKDLEQAEPDLFVSIHHFKNDMLLQNFFKLFEQGQKEGQIRADMNVKFLVHLFAEAFQNSVPHKLAMQYLIPLSALPEMILKILLEGFLVRKSDDLTSEKINNSQ